MCVEKGRFDVTYYDYDRMDKNEWKCEMYFDKAIQVININVISDVSRKMKIAKYRSWCRTVAGVIQ